MQSNGVGKGRVKAAMMLPLFTSMRQSPGKPRAVQWPPIRKKSDPRSVRPLQEGWAG